MLVRVRCASEMAWASQKPHLQGLRDARIDSRLQGTENNPGLHCQPLGYRTRFDALGLWIPRCVWCSTGRPRAGQLPESES